MRVWIKLFHDRIVRAAKEMMIERRERFKSQWLSQNFLKSLRSSLIISR
jgi:hypothetical protein